MELKVSMENQKKPNCLKNVCHGASQIQIKFVNEKFIDVYSHLPNKQEFPFIWINWFDL